MLFYEYMHNKSVAYHLDDEERRRALDWQTRNRIILAVAKGLPYFHMDSNMHAIHRDIKTFVGTFGYMAPEYVRDGIYSTKCDLYSVGVVMLELWVIVLLNIPSMGEKRIIQVEGSFNDGGRPCSQ
ncbi:hypothetical protein LXL04_029010 [Taraxacum kok-saghyz]